MWSNLADRQTGRKALVRLKTKTAGAKNKETLNVDQKEPPGTNETVATKECAEETGGDRVFGIRCKFKLKRGVTGFSA